jgi:hypothetical protein
MRDLIVKKGVTIAGWCIVIGLILGGIGAEAEFYKMIRIANGVIALGFLVLMARVVIRGPRQSMVAFVAKLLAFGGLAGLFIYLAICFWSSVGFFSCVGAVLDEM